MEMHVGIEQNKKKIFNGKISDVKNNIQFILT